MRLAASQLSNNHFLGYQKKNLRDCAFLFHLQAAAMFVSLILAIKVPAFLSAHLYTSLSLHLIQKAGTGKELKATSTIFGPYENEP